jgi:hypothetical protein
MTIPIKDEYPVEITELRKEEMRSRQILFQTPVEGDFRISIFREKIVYSRPTVDDEWTVKSKEDTGKYSILISEYLEEYPDDIHLVDKLEEVFEKMVLLKEENIEV